MGGGDHGVGIGGVADHQHPHIGPGAAVERLARGGEDLGVGAQQVGALHPLGAGLGPDQQRDVDPVEGRDRIVVDLRLRQ